MIVDHSAPFHDGYCRCRSCKPPLVGEAGQALFRVRVALAIGAVTSVALILIQQVRP